MSGPSASFNGFIDSKGRQLSWEEGCQEAARCVMQQHETDFVERLMTDHCTPEEVLEWLVYPDTGEFPENVARLTEAERL